MVVYVTRSGMPPDATGLALGAAADEAAGFEADGEVAAPLGAGDALDGVAAGDETAGAAEPQAANKLPA
jgi:hypothetical protein